MRLESLKVSSQIHYPVDSEVRRQVRKARKNGSHLVVGSRDYFEYLYGPMVHLTSAHDHGIYLTYLHHHGVRPFNAFPLREAANG